MRNRRIYLCYRNPLGTAILIDMETSDVYGSIIVCNRVFGFEARVKHLPRHL